MDKNQQTLTEHNEIKAWAEKHGAQPAMMESASEERKHGLRFDFPGKDDEELLTEETRSKKISWEEFFRIFDNEKLALMVYGDKETSDPTWAYRFVKKDAGSEIYEERVEKMVDELKEALEVTEKVVVGQEPVILDPALRGETGNDTLRDNPAPNVVGEQSMLGDMTDPASDDDPTLVAKEMGLLLEEDKKRLKDRNE